MSYYECKRCRHITKQKIEMIRHLKRKKKCTRNIDSYNYEDNELEIMSLVKHTKNEENDKTKKNKKLNDKNNDLSNKISEKICNKITIKENENNFIDTSIINNNILDNINTNISDNNIDTNIIDIFDNNINNDIDTNTIDNNIENNIVDVFDNNINTNIIDNNIDNSIDEDITDNVKPTCVKINDLKNELNKNFDSCKIINNKDCKKFTCDICLRIFSRKYNLKRHKLKCQSEKINSQLNLNSNSNNNNQNNTTNNYNTINNNYNKNLFVNLNIEPFDNDWDVSRITKFTRHSILLSKIMYSNLLDNILQNEKNLNVVIEKETNTGIVYKNNAEKFITMNMQEIIDKSMDKLNKHLKDFYAESLKDDEFVIMDKIFQEQIVNIENKYTEYKNNNEIKKKVEEFITQIYDKKKENALKLYNNTLLKNNDDNGY